MGDDNLAIETPLWLKALENKRKRPHRLAHDVGAGAPCLVCKDKCKGLNLHFWRKICIECKCRKDDHDVQDEDDCASFEILFGAKKMKGITLKFNKQSKTFDWIPPNVTPELAIEYLNSLPENKLPISNSEGAKLRKQQLEKQLPIYDVDPSACHELTTEEKEALEKYLYNLKENVVGQGLVFKYQPRRASGHLIHDNIKIQQALTEDRQQQPVLSTSSVPRPIGSYLMKTQPSIRLPESSTVNFETYPVPSHLQSSTSIPFTNQSEIVSSDQHCTGPLTKGECGELSKNQIPIYLANSDDINVMKGFGKTDDLKQLSQNVPSGNDSTGRETRPDPHLQTGSVPYNISSSKNVNSHFGTAKPFMRDQKLLESHGQLIKDHVPSYKQTDDTVKPFALKTPNQFINKSLGKYAFDKQNNNITGIKGNVDQETGNYETGTEDNNTGIGGYMNNKTSLEDNDPRVPSDYQLNQEDSTKSMEDENADKDLQSLGSNNKRGNEDSVNVNPEILNNNLTPDSLMNPISTQGDIISSKNIFDATCSENVPFSLLQESGNIAGNRQIGLPSNTASEISKLQETSDSTPEIFPEPPLVCSQCFLVLTEGDVVVATERAGDTFLWHARCFVCDTCNELLVDLTYFYYKGKVYCGRHFADKANIPRCAACDELIFVKQYTLAEDVPYHFRHFCCYNCDEPLGGQQYIPAEDQHYCLNCYQIKYGKRCKTCSVLINPNEQRVSWKDLHFHVSAECFKCTGCLNTLLNKRFVVSNNNVFCNKDCTKLGEQ